MHSLKNMFLAYWKYHEFRSKFYVLALVSVLLLIFSVCFCVFMFSRCSSFCYLICVFFVFKPFFFAEKSYFLNNTGPKIEPKKPFCLSVQFGRLFLMTSFSFNAIAAFVSLN